MKGLLVLSVITFLSFFIWSNSSGVYAQGNAPSASDFSTWLGITIPNFSTETSVGDIISYILWPWAYGLAGLLVLLYTVLGGFQVLISQGDPKRMAAGREKITYAIIGFIIMFCAYWIVKLVGEILEYSRNQDLICGDRKR